MMSSIALHPLSLATETFGTPLIAHQGGWDEFLLVAGPIVVIIGLLAVVKRRIDTRLASVAESRNPTSESGSQGLDGTSIDSRSDPS